MDQYLSPILSNTQLILSGFLGALVFMILRDFYKSFRLFKLELTYEGKCILKRAFGPIAAKTEGTVERIVFDKHLRQYAVFNCIFHYSEGIPIYLNIIVPLNMVEPLNGN